MESPDTASALTERGQALVQVQHAFVTAMRHQGQHSARAKRLTNLCSGPVAIGLLLCFCIAALCIPWLLYDHDIVGDGGDYVTVPASIPPSSINWSKRVSNSGSKKKKTVTYYIHADVRPHFADVQGAHSSLHAATVQQGSKGGPGGQDLPMDVLNPPGHSCAFFLPNVLCRMFEDTFGARERPREDGLVRLQLQFSDYEAGQAALAKVRAATSVLQDRDTGRLFLLRDAPIEPYLLIAVPLAVAAVILACNSGSQRVELWNRAAAVPLPAPVRVWVDDLKRYLWQLQPAASQLLPKDYSGRAVQVLGAACLGVNSVLLVDSIRANALCSAAPDCAAPVVGAVQRGLLGLLQTVCVLVPLVAYIFGSQATAVGSAVARAQLCVEETYAMNRVQNVAWPAGATRRVYVRQQVRPSTGGVAGQLTITAGRLRLQRWRVQKVQKNLKHDIEYDEAVPLPELHNAAVPCGSMLSTCADVQVPADATLSSVPGRGLPFNTWYLVYELDIQGVGKDSLMVPLHVVPELQAPPP